MVEKEHNNFKSNISNFFKGSLGQSTPLSVGLI